MRIISQSINEAMMKKLRGIFEIRFVTSEESALEANLCDHEQLVVLSEELSKYSVYSKIKADKRLRK